MFTFWAYSFHTPKSASTGIILILSKVTMSNSLTDLLYSGGFPAATMIQPWGMLWLPNVLH